MKKLVQRLKRVYKQEPYQVLFIVALILASPLPIGFYEFVLASMLLFGCFALAYKISLK